MHSINIFKKAGGTVVLRLFFVIGVVKTMQCFPKFVFCCCELVFVPALEGGGRGEMNRDVEKGELFKKKK